MKFFYTENARKSACEDIKKQIDILGKSKELDYQAYRDICKYLNMLKDAIDYEDKKEKLEQAGLWN